MLGNETKNEKIYRNPNAYLKETNETNSKEIEIRNIKIQIKTIDSRTHSS